MVKAVFVSIRPHPQIYRYFRKRGFYPFQKTQTKHKIASTQTAFLKIHIRPKVCGHLIIDHSKTMGIIMEGPHMDVMVRCPHTFGHIVYHCPYENAKMI